MGRTNKRRCSQCGKYHKIGENCKTYDKSPNKGNKNKKFKPSKPNFYINNDIDDSWK